MSDTPAYTPVDSNRRYVLGEGDDFFGVWDRRTGALLHRFPATEDGFAEAETKYDQLVREARTTAVPRVIRWIAVVSAVLWVVTGVSSAVLLSFQDQLFGPGPSHGVEQWLRWLQLADTSGFHVVVASVVILFVLWLGDRWDALKPKERGRRESLQG